MVLYQPRGWDRKRDGREAQKGGDIRISVLIHVEV